MLEIIPTKREREMKKRMKTLKLLAVIAPLCFSSLVTFAEDTPVSPAVAQESNLYAELQDIQLGRVVAEDTFESAEVELLDTDEVVASTVDSQVADANDEISDQIQSDIADDTQIEVAEENTEDEAQVEVAEENKEDEVQVEVAEDNTEDEVQVEVAEDNTEDEAQVEVSEENKEDEVQVEVTEENTEDEAQVEVAEENKEDEVQIEVTEENKEDEVQTEVTVENKEDEVQTEVTEENKEDEVQTEKDKEIAELKELIKKQNKLLCEREDKDTKPEANLEENGVMALIAKMTERQDSIDDRIDSMIQMMMMQTQSMLAMLNQSQGPKFKYAPSILDGTGAYIDPVHGLLNSSLQDMRSGRGSENIIIYGDFIQGNTSSAAPSLRDRFFPQGSMFNQNSAANMMSDPFGFNFNSISDNQLGSFNQLNAQNSNQFNIAAANDRALMMQHRSAVLGQQNPAAVQMPAQAPVLPTQLNTTGIQDSSSRMIN